MTRLRYSLRCFGTALLLAAASAASLADAPSDRAIHPHADEPTAVSTASPLHVARLKDLSSVEGIRDNQLVGYGLVVGLAGTGDKQQTIFSVQTLANMLQKMGINIQSQLSTVQVRNIAGVFVTATLPPFSRPGVKIDVTVSSV